MTPARILLLTQADCGLCDHAKDVLGRVSQDVPLTVEEVDLSSDRGRQLAERSGVMFAPGVFLDDRVFAFGRLSEKKLRRALERRVVRAGRP